MTNRLNSIDFLRGLAVIFMIQVHVYYYWIYWTGVDYGFLEDVIFLIGSFAAPLFITISGASYFLFIKAKQEQLFSKKQILSEVIKRAGFIFIVPTLLQFFFGFFFQINEKFILYWSVFQVISISMPCYFFLPFLNKKWRFVSAFSIFLLIIFLYSIIKFLEIKFLYFLIDDTFEFLPWTSFFLFGLIFGAFFRNKHDSFQFKCLLPYFLFGFILFLIGFTDFLLNRTVDDKRIEFFFLIYGGLIMLLFLTYLYLDIQSRQNFLFRKLIWWGKFAFSIYYIQYIMIGAGIFLFPLILREFYFKGFNFFLFILLFLTISFGIEIILLLWKKKNYFLSLEWIMNKISSKTIFNKDCN